MDTISMKAYAKINLGLDVTGTLDNGYHTVRMIMQSVGIYDKVNIKKNTTGAISIKTNLPFLPCGSDNLVYKAAALMKHTYGIREGIDIDLYKYIPVAAGMAGGSSDAAAVLKGMNRMFDIGAPADELMRIGVAIGADVPYCIMGGTALAEGIGDVLTRLPDCPDCYIVLGKPAVNVSTKSVYGKLIIGKDTIHPDIDSIIGHINNKNIKGIADGLSNVLESVTLKEYPVIGKIKNEMVKAGALNSLMSGSGPTVFGLFEDYDKADACSNYIRQNGLARNSYVTSPISTDISEE